MSFLKPLTVYLSKPELCSTGSLGAIYMFTLLACWMRHCNHCRCLGDANAHIYQSIIMNTKWSENSTLGQFSTNGFERQIKMSKAKQLILSTTMEGLLFVSR